MGKQLEEGIRNELEKDLSNFEPSFSGRILHYPRKLPFIVLLATGKPFSWLDACLTWKAKAILFCSKCLN